MLDKAHLFAVSGLFNPDTKFRFSISMDTLPAEYINNLFMLPNTVILNFSYFFGSLSNDDIEKLASTINDLLDRFPLNKYVLIYLNADIETSSRAFYLFRKLVPRLDYVMAPKTETISYHNAELSTFDKTETFYYEVLSN